MEFRMLVRKNMLILLILGLHLLLLTNIKFTAWPEMLLWPYLMLKGWLPYKDIAIAHNPLLLFDLTLFYKLFGVGVEQLKMFTWVLILFVDAVTYFIVQKIWGKKTALLSVVFLIPLTIYYDANGLWFDLGLALIFPFIFYFTEVKKYIWLGVFWGLAFLTKQTAIWLLIPIIIYTFKGATIKGMFQVFERLLLGTLLVLVPFLIILWSLNILPDYLFWAYKFAGGALPFSEGQIYFPAFRQLILGLFPFLSFAVIYPFNSDKTFLKLFVWMACASLGVYPRWELFHILPAVPFIAIMMALVTLNISKKDLWYYKYLSITFISIFVLLTIKGFVGKLDNETRFMEDNVVQISSYVKNITKKEDKIFVLNDWEHYYVLTDTLPVTKPWIPQFSWYLAVPGLQEKMYEDLVAGSPDIIVMHPYSSSGLDAFQPKKIADYVYKYYYPEKSLGSSIIMFKR